MSGPETWAPPHTSGCRATAASPCRPPSAQGVEPGLGHFTTGSNNTTAAVSLTNANGGTPVWGGDFTVHPSKRSLGERNQRVEPATDSI